jgi:hypothetical protein
MHEDEPGSTVFRCESLKGSYYWGNQDIDGMSILKWISENNL